MYAKDAELTTKDYTVPTSNELYTLKVGLISIKATKQLLVAKNISLQPHYNRQEFQKHIPAQKERYNISIPSIEFRNMDWWNYLTMRYCRRDRSKSTKPLFLCTWIGENRWDL